MSQKMITLKDNTPNVLIKDEQYALPILEKYSHETLSTLAEKGSLVLLSNEMEELKKLTLWNICDDTIHTNNLMGFIGLPDCPVRITSRFTKGAKKDYFLHYMLQKVFLGQVVNLDIGTTDTENVWDFFYYLFPHYLSKALNQGLYKEYVHKKYNNINVRGAIDVKRHIQKNVLFLGKIAYNTREHSYNNNITQLIRHTVEFVQRLPIGRLLLNANVKIRENVEHIKHLTPDFHGGNRRTVMQNCNGRISNPYWKDYESLRKICLKILKQEKLSFDKSDDKVHGILFDGSWLWEEYLATFLPKDFKHPDNRSGCGRLHLAKNESGNNCLICYPDFYSNKIVLDAKYKKFPDKGKEPREDIYQVITYMYRLKSEKGILVYPDLDGSNKTEYLLHDEGYGGTLIHACMQLEKEDNDFSSFCGKMAENEKSFCNDYLQ